MSKHNTNQPEIQQTEKKNFCILAFLLCYNIAPFNAKDRNVFIILTERETDTWLHITPSQVTLNVQWRQLPNKLSSKVMHYGAQNELQPILPPDRR